MKLNILKYLWSRGNCIAIKRQVSSNWFNTGFAQRWFIFRLYWLSASILFVNLLFNRPSCHQNQFLYLDVQFSISQMGYPKIMHHILRWWVLCFKLLSFSYYSIYLYNSAWIFFSLSGLTCATFSFKYEFQCVHDLNQSCQIQFQPTQVHTEKVLLVYYFKVNGCHSTLSMYTGKRRTRPLETGKPYIKTNKKITLFVNTAFCHSTVLYVFAKPVDTSKLTSPEPSSHFEYQFINPALAVYNAQVAYSLQNKISFYHILSHSKDISSYLFLI